jgi:hypothetical protein
MAISNLSKDPGLVRSKMCGLLLLVCCCAVGLDLLDPPDWLALALPPNVDEDVSCIEIYACNFNCYI